MHSWYPLSVYSFREAAQCVLAAYDREYTEMPREGLTTK